MKRFNQCFILCTMVFALLMPSTVFAADKKLLNEASITLSSDVIPVGGTTKIKVRLLAEMTSLTYAKLTPEVSDESILTVELDGYSDYIVTGVQEGSAEVVFNIPGWTEERYPITVLSKAAYEEKMKTPQEVLDFTTYSNQIAAIIQYDEIANEAYIKNRIDTGTNRKQRYTAFNNVILPNYTKLVVEAKKIKAPNPELQALHQIYLKAIKTQLEAMTMMKEALYKTKISSNDFKAANKKMDEGVKYEGQFVDGIDKYRKKYGI
ncbi:hypothetical protein [Paenibacillus sp. B2(2019)]|uniref:hypothetical protein n=1 Tax=Paenibacillus sp. B2(2019) TaxID=2607754 RepID=UPI0011F2C05E|nr:hypothetical protein [Paenibacillus sp. B2(2019)]KAA1191578.1 hypothetical protein PAENI_05065 [Paenibacillus sp. B2(2019)]